MDISVIIACYNGEKTLAEQFQALQNQDYSGKWEVIYVDNRSTDSSLEIARSYRDCFENFMILEAGDKQCKAHALNRALEHARGRSLLFCDADDVVSPGYVQAMARALEKHDFVAAAFDFEALNDPRVSGSRRNRQKDSLQSYDYPPYLPHAGGGSLGVTMQALKAVGGFDEDFVILEDTDLCFKAQLAGYPLIFVPEAVLQHRLRSSLNSLYRQQKNYGMYNVRLYKKYRKLGMPALSRKTSIRGWYRLLRQVKGLGDPAARYQFISLLGWRMGRLAGSFKYRTWAL